MCRQIARTLLRRKRRRLANDAADLRHAAISLCSCAPPCEDVCVGVCVWLPFRCLYLDSSAYTPTRQSACPRFQWGPQRRPSAWARHASPLVCTDHTAGHHETRYATVAQSSELAKSHPQPRTPRQVCSVECVRRNEPWLSHWSVRPAPNNNATKDAACLATYHGPVVCL